MISTLQDIQIVHFISVPLHVLETMRNLIPLMDTVAKTTDVKVIWVLQGIHENESSW